MKGRFCLAISKFLPCFSNGVTVMYVRADLLVFILLQVNTDSIIKDFHQI